MVVGLTQGMRMLGLVDRVGPYATQCASSGGSALGVSPPPGRILVRVHQCLDRQPIMAACGFVSRPIHFSTLHARLHPLPNCTLPVSLPGPDPQVVAMKEELAVVREELEGKIKENETVHMESFEHRQLSEVACVSTRGFGPAFPLDGGGSTSEAPCPGLLILTPDPPTPPYPGVPVSVLGKYQIPGGSGPTVPGPHERVSGPE